MFPAHGGTNWWGSHAAGPKREASWWQHHPGHGRWQKHRAGLGQRFLVCISHKMLVGETHTVSHMWWVSVKLSDAFPVWFRSPRCRQRHWSLRSPVAASLSHRSHALSKGCTLPGEDLNPTARDERQAQLESFQRRRKILPFPLSGCRVVTWTLGLPLCIPAYPQWWIMPGGLGPPRTSAGLWCVGSATSAQLRGCVRV